MTFTANRLFKSRPQRLSQAEIDRLEDERYERLAKQIDLDMIGVLVSGDVRTIKEQQNLVKQQIGGSNEPPSFLAEKPIPIVKRLIDLQ